MLSRLPASRGGLRAPADRPAQTGQRQGARASRQDREKDEERGGEPARAPAAFLKRIGPCRVALDVPQKPLLLAGPGEVCDAGPGGI